MSHDNQEMNRFSAEEDKKWIYFSKLQIQNNNTFYTGATPSQDSGGAN